MKFYNSPCSNLLNNYQAILFVMPMDIGAWFGIVNEDNCTLSILRSHFEPWGPDQTINTVLDQDIINVLTLGCEAMTDDRNIATILQSAAIGTSPVQFKDVCVCVPAAWSGVIRCRQKSIGDPSQNDGKKLHFSTSTSARINTQNLLELGVNSKCYGCVDAVTNYQLNDETCWRRFLKNQHYTRLGYKTDFFMIEQDKHELICKSLSCVKKYDTGVIWTSDLCMFSHLNINTDTIVLDLDECSIKIHWDAESDAPNQQIPIDQKRLLQALKKQVGELPLGLDELHRQYTVSGKKEFLELEGTLPATLKKALSEVSADFWSPLFQLLKENSKSRNMVIVGDCALTILSLMDAATAFGWKTSIRWPAIRLGADPSTQAVSARVALRAIENFQRFPFEDFPIGNRYFYKAGHFLQTTTSGTLKKICAMLM